MNRSLWLRAIRRWLSSGRGAAPAGRRVPAPRSRRPILETLEDRCVPPGGGPLLVGPRAVPGPIIAINQADATAGGAIIELAANSVYDLTGVYVPTSPGGVTGFWYGINALPPITNNVVIEGNGSIIERASSATTNFRAFF